MKRFPGDPLQKGVEWEWRDCGITPTRRISVQMHQAFDSELCVLEISSTNICVCFWIGLVDVIARGSALERGISKSNNYITRKIHVIVDVKIKYR